MNERNVSHVPVISGYGRLRGIITRHSLVMSPASVRKHRHTKDRLVAHVMDRDYEAVAPDHSLVEVGRLLLDGGVGCLPVLDDDRFLVGLVTARDFIRLVMRGESIIPAPLGSGSDQDDFAVAM
jgi:CBS domain-containing protein